jgi:hypothetical protein
VADVMRMFLRPCCIGTTKDGHPTHPCMAPYTVAPRLWATGPTVIRRAEGQ